MHFAISPENREEVLAFLRGTDEAEVRAYRDDRPDYPDRTFTNRRARVCAAILAVEAGATEVDLNGRYGVVVNGWLTIATTSGKWRYRNSANWIRYFDLRKLLKKLVTDKLPAA